MSALPQSHDDHARAKALMAVGRYEAAAAVLSEAVARDPGDARLLCELALCHHFLDHPEAALETVDRALAVAPGSEWGHRLRTVILIGQGTAASREEAQRAADEAVRLAPHSVSAWVVHSRAARVRKDFPMAFASATRAIELNPMEGSGHEAYGLAMLDAGNALVAEQAFRHQLSLDADNASAINNLGRALLKQRRKQEATALFARAAALDPTEAAYRRNVGLGAYSLTRVSGPILLGVVLAALVAGVWGLLAAIGVLGGITAWKKHKLRTGQLRGPDGQPLPSGVWDALRDYERSHSSIGPPRVWLALVVTAIVLMLAGVALDDGSDAVGPDALALVGVVLAFVALLGFLRASRRRRREQELDPRR
jgi:tetratricopeptide (TPR) repeat protein